MQCQTCHGSGLLYVEPMENSKVSGFVPCPDCLGGQQHCCEGECEQPKQEQKLPAVGSFDHG